MDRAARKPRRPSCLKAPGWRLNPPSGGTARCRRRNPARLAISQEAGSVGEVLRWCGTGQPRSCLGTPPSSPRTTRRAQRGWPACLTAGRGKGAAVEQEVEGLGSAPCAVPGFACPPECLGAGALGVEADAGLKLLPLPEEESPKQMQTLIRPWLRISRGAEAACVATESLFVWAAGLVGVGAGTVGALLTGLSGLERGGWGGERPKGRGSGRRISARGAPRGRAEGMVCLGERAEGAASRGGGGCRFASGLMEALYGASQRVQSIPRMRTSRPFPSPEPPPTNVGKGSGDTAQRCAKLARL